MKMLVCPDITCKFNRANLCTKESVVLILVKDDLDSNIEHFACESYVEKIRNKEIKLDHDYECIKSGNIYKVSGLSVETVVIYNTNNFISRTVPRHSFHDRFVEVI